MILEKGKFLFCTPLEIFHLARLFLSLSHTLAYVTSTKCCFASYAMQRIKSSTLTFIFSHSILFLSFLSPWTLSLTLFYSLSFRYIFSVSKMWEIIFINPAVKVPFPLLFSSPKAMEESSRVINFIIQFFLSLKILLILKKFR